MSANNNVGAKIRCLREMRGISLDEMAERCGMTVDQIGKIEGGDVATSLSPLLKIARGLGVRLGTFLDDADVSGPVVSSTDTNKSTIRFAGEADRKGLDFHPLAANKRDRNMEPFVIDVNPLASSNYKLCGHEGEEFIYVMDGEIEVAYGKDKFIVRKGETIYYDSIVPHHLHAAGDSPAKIMAVLYSPH